MESTIGSQRTQRASVGLVLAGCYNLAWAAYFFVSPEANRISVEVPSLQSLDFLYIFLVAALGTVLLIAAPRPFLFWKLSALALVAKLMGFMLVLLGFLVGYLSSALLALSIFHDVLWAPLLAWVAYRGFKQSMKPIPHQADLALALIDSKGDSYLALSYKHPLLLVFLRHFGCTFCRETLRDLKKRKAHMEQQGIVPVFVHMGNADQAEAYLEKYGWPNARHIADPHACLYQQFAIGRASFTQVFGWKNWKRGVAAGVFKGLGVGLPVGDGFRMSGLFLIYEGQVLASFHHQYAADVPDYEGLFACELPFSRQ